MYWIWSVRRSSLSAERRRPKNESRIRSRRGSRCGTSTALGRYCHMGMEGKLRQVSETELNTSRKNPEELYSDMMRRANPPEVQKFIAKMMELQKSAGGKRIE